MTNDSGGGGGSAGRFTYWGDKNIYEMWYMVDGADYAAYGQLVTGWKRASELAYLHKSRLESYKSHLASIWSVEDSEAAKVYIARIDELIASVQDTADVAADNQTVSSAMLSALYEARGKLKPIYDRYRALNGVGTNGEQIPTDAPSGESPGATDPKIGVENEARSVMYSLSTDLSQSQRQFVQPKPYIPPGRGIQEGSTNYGNGNTTSTGDGLVLPLVPVPQPTPTPQQYIAPSPVTPVPVTSGPDLSGLNPTTTLPNPTTSLPSGPIGGTSPTTPIGAGPIGPGGVIGAPPLGGGTGLGRGVTPSGLIGTGGGAGPRTATTGGLRANPPGGLIGGGVPPRGGPGAAAIGGGVPPRGGPGAAAIGGGVPPRGGPGAAAIGGRPVIGGAGGRAGLTGAHGAMIGGPGATGRNAGMLPTAMGGRPGQRSENEDGQDYDPDTEWAVAQGVTPVVDAPTPDAPVNPGPAIGL